MYETILTHAVSKHVALASGTRVGLPVRYLDFTATIAHFPAPASAISRLLPGKSLAPVRVAPGTAVLSVAAFEYRRLADLEPYNEVVIGTPVLHKPGLDLPLLPFLFPRGFRDFGFFIVNAPVTTEDARELGVNAWGYPKFLADIAFDEIDNIRRCRVQVEGRNFLTLEVQQIPAKIQQVDFRIYTVKDGRLSCHWLRTEGLYGRSFLPGGGRLSFGDHPLAQALKGLRTGENPIARVFGSNVASLLCEADQSFAM